MPSDRHDFETETLRAWLRAVSRCQDATHGMIRPRPAAGVVVAFTLGRIWFCAVGCSWPVVAPLGQAQRKRKMCRNTVVSWRADAEHHSSVPKGQPYHSPGRPFPMARVPVAACVAQRRPYPWLKTDAPSGACPRWRPHSMSPPITDAEHFPAVSDRNSRPASPKLPSESDPQELVNMGHE